MANKMKREEVPEEHLLYCLRINKFSFFKNLMGIQAPFYMITLSR